MNVPGPHFRLTFGTSLGRSRMIRINNIHMGTTDGHMINAMNAIIMSQALSNAAGGDIITARRAQQVETTVTPITLA